MCSAKQSFIIIIIGDFKHMTTNLKVEKMLMKVISAVLKVTDSVQEPCWCSCLWPGG